MYAIDPVNWFEGLILNYETETLIIIALDVALLGPLLFIIIIGAYLFIYDLQVYLALLLGGRYKAFLYCVALWLRFAAR